MERYGLLTIIVLGESILAASVAIQAALGESHGVGPLLPLIAGGLVIVYSMWWLYFDTPKDALENSFPRAVLWGYGHYFIFASVAAVGAGLAVAADRATQHAGVSVTVAGAAIAIPVTVFLWTLWLLNDQRGYGAMRVVGPIAGLIVLATPFTGHTIPTTAAILAALVTLKVAVKHRNYRNVSPS